MSIHTSFAKLAHSIDSMTKSESLQKISELLTRKEVSVVSFLNAHAANMSCHDIEFFDCLSSSSLLLRDGVGVEILLKRLNLPPKDNLNGTDLIPEILEIAKKKESRVAIFGTSEKTIERTKSLLLEQGVNVVCSLHGFAKQEEYLRICQNLSPDLIILGMGMPKQEKLAKAMIGSLSSGVIVNGGAIFDFMAGSVKRAPKWIQTLKLEWAFRLLQEPRRLFKRYVIGNVVFLWRCW